MVKINLLLQFLLNKMEIYYRLLPLQGKKIAKHSFTIKGRGFIIYMGNVILTKYILKNYMEVLIMLVHI